MRYFRPLSLEYWSKHDIIVSMTPQIEISERVICLNTVTLTLSFARILSLT